ncbi:helix-turn-helix transcriptional regulator [Streptomyces sp. HK10]|uniref:helix-turn-helix transcriptional regulator n=1 Tax=Streptomyces sp. HK10 TaxID=3373255 RepID=UPI00374A37E1
MTTATPVRNQTLTLAEVLDELRMSRAAFYRMRARGQGPKCLKLPNGQIRVRRSDLDVWFDACEEAAC